MKAALAGLAGIKFLGACALGVEAKHSFALPLCYKVNISHQGLTIMGIPFEHIASPYDSIYAYSPISLLQRKHVWLYIQTILPQLRGFEMLELNCSASEDAVLFADGELNIMATDISSETLRVTEKKAEHISIQSGISSHHFLDLESLNENLFDKKFDLVFSNFGGVNSINPAALKSLFRKLPQLLNPGGRFIGVVMPRYCAWEMMFFLLRFQFKKAFRRLTSQDSPDETPGSVGKTWYYRPAQLKAWSRDNFRVVSLKPVGVALPPAYLERFFSLKRRWLLKLNGIERKLGESAALSGISDNYIIDLQLN